MITRPTLYINRLTTVDCAILSQWGISLNQKMFSEAVGFSFNVNVEISGDLDPIENVVVDFGALKKFLKSEIDNITYGYDHKLIIPKSLVGLDQDNPLQISMNPDEVVIKNGGVEILRTPRDAVRVTQTQELDERLSQSVGFLESMIHREFDKHGEYITNEETGADEVLHALGLELKAFLQECVSVEYPNQNLVVESVSCDCETTKPHKLYVRNIPGPHIKRTVSNYFSYTHGLKNSTSMGCRNIVHGHLSYIQLVSGLLPMHDIKGNNEHVLELQQLCNQIAHDLNCTHFVHDENIVKDETGTKDSYYAQDRGSFSTMLSSNMPVETHKGSITNSDCLFSKIVILETESTVENLMGYVFDQYEAQFKELQVSSIYVSEGLQKGSYLHVEHEQQD